MTLRCENTWSHDLGYLYWPPMGTLELLRSAYIFVCSECYFSVRLALIELSTAKIQMNSAELLITFILSVHVIFLPNKLFKGVIPPSKEGDPL